MKSVRFVLSRHPLDPTGGGSSRISRLMMEAAARSADVTATALSSLNHLESPWPVDCVPKPPLRPLRVVSRSMRDRRSLIHTRFRVAELTAQLRTTSQDTLVAHHAYMAESVLDAIGGEATQRLAVNLDVSESAVLEAGGRHRRLRSFEAGRTQRDEVRCLAAAQSVSGFDRDELDRYTGEGIGPFHVLRPCFPPVGRPLREAPPHLLFLADRTWRPNYEGLEHLLRLWPRIHAESTRAQVLVVGQGPLPKSSTQDGVVDLGYVESLDSVWGDVRALAAPITIGGGVRIKVLDAAAHGIPVVASPEAVGSLDRYLPVTPASTDDQFVQQCIELLNDPAHARQESATLFEANREWWSRGAFHQDVCDWLGLG